jgi:hypothetical protein
MVKKSSCVDKNSAASLTIKKDKVQLLHKLVMKIKQMTTHEGPLYGLAAEADWTTHFRTLANHASIPMGNCHM